MRQSDEKLKEAAKQFQDNGIKVSFFNTPMFKITLPGTEPLSAKREQTAEAREKRIANTKPTSIAARKISSRRSGPPTSWGPTRSGCSPSCAPPNRTNSISGLRT